MSKNKYNRYTWDLDNYDDKYLLSSTKDIRNQITNLDTRISTNQTNINTINANVINLDTRVSTNQSNINTINSYVTNLDTRVSTNQSNINDLDTRVSTNETNITNLNNKLWLTVTFKVKDENDIIKTLEFTDWILQKIN